MDFEVYGAPSAGLGAAGRQALAQEDPGTLTTFFNFLSRPGFAVRDALVGDFGGAAKNILQFGLDLPTGGFIDPDYNLIGLANTFIPEEYEFNPMLVDQEEQREFSDVLDEWGVLNKRGLGTWSKLGIDIAGGVLTDPLTLLTGGGKGVATGTLAGATKKTGQQTVAQALRQTPEGLQTLAQASDEVLKTLTARAAQGSHQSLGVMRLLSNVNSFDELVGASDDLLRASNVSRDTLGLTIRGIEQRAAEKVFWQYANETGQISEDILKRGLGTHTLQAEGAIDDGLRALERAGLTETKGSLYWNFPLGQRREVPFWKGDFWGGVGNNLTAPGWVRRGLHRYDATKPAAQFVDEVAGEGWNWMKSVYDRFSFGKAPQALKDRVRGFAYQMTGNLKRNHRRGIQLFGGMDDARQVKMAQGIREAEGFWRDAINGEHIAEGVQGARGQPGSLTQAIADGRFDFMREGYDQREKILKALNEGSFSADEIQEAITRGHIDHNDIAALELAEDRIARSARELAREQVQLGSSFRSLEDAEKALAPIERNFRAAQEQITPLFARRAQLYDAARELIDDDDVMEEAVEAARIFAETAPRGPFLESVRADMRSALDTIDENLLEGIPAVPATNAYDDLSETLHQALVDRAEAEEFLSTLHPRAREALVERAAGTREAMELNARLNDLRGARNRILRVVNIFRNHEAVSRTAGAQRLQFADKLSQIKALPKYLDDFYETGKPLTAEQATEAFDRLLARELADDWDVAQEVLADFRRIPGELRHEGVWKTSEKANPFYIPRQGEAFVFSALDEALRNKEVQDGILSALRQAGKSGPKTLTTKDVFSLPRKAWPEFIESLKQHLTKAGVDVNDLMQEAGDLTEDALVNNRISELWRLRMNTHAKTMFRAKSIGAAKELGEIQPGNMLDTYLQHQLAPGKFRDSYLGKILGGGTFRVPMGKGSSELAAWAKQRAGKGGFNAKLVTRNGKQQLQFRWPGLNFWWKPLLTSAPFNPAFHIRNIMSAIFMSAFDPDVGRFAGFKALTGAFMNNGIVKHLDTLAKKADKLDPQGALHQLDGNDVTALMRFIDARPPLKYGAHYFRQIAPESREQVLRALEGVKHLKESGKRIGNYTWDEVLNGLDNALGNTKNRADLMFEMQQVDQLGREIFTNGSRAGIAFRKLVAMGQNLGNAVENRFRANMFLDLLSKDVPVDDAIRRVNRAFVDYSVQGTTEQFLRDVIPFARFTIGSAAWLKEIAERPRLVGWMARTQASAHDTAREDMGGFIPEGLKDTLALPLPWRTPEGNLEFLMGLGLPHEAALNILGLGTLEGQRRQFLGGLTPPLSTYLGAVTDRNFYFGTEFGEYRRVPEWMKILPAGAFRRIELPDGKVRYEIDGRINEMVNALPFSRLLKTIDKMLDSNRNFGSAALNIGTGARTMRVDERRELRKALAEYIKEKAKTGEAGEVISYFIRSNDPNEPVPEDLAQILHEYKRLKKPKEDTQGVGSLGLGRPNPSGAPANFGRQQGFGIGLR